MPRDRRINNRPRPWGSHYAAMTTASTGHRDFVDGFAFMERDGSEALSWHHIEDVAAYDEDDLEMFTARTRERIFVSEHFSGPAYAYEDEDFSGMDAHGFSWESGEKEDSGSGEAEERGFRGFFGAGVKKRSDMREVLRPVQERGSREGSSGSSLAQESASSSKKGTFGFGAKGKGPAGKK
ncbi:hypothetical protein CNMCM5793_007168 [Aspergillus hiratsukae]|uniref:Uncharacterized protein n=1 Tax=Aspergillus hiratsukae TaxID=1194566 RepID=A0A8H6P532_9EURO|nr:hypothetical protein CNMCM5793_007168 [Aspergillus hiratsukae]KAF7157545.1 hypothetical protein CNMCM6106_003352 [Aspergillus hiratsukae]